VDITGGARTLLGLRKYNVIIGKNGAGKSTWLRYFDEQKGLLPNVGLTKYITPERGGVLQFQGGLEDNFRNPEWASTNRRRNQADNFRYMSVIEYRRLENLVLKKIETDEATRANLAFTFDSTVADINRLLDNIEIKRSDVAGFEIGFKGGQATLNLTCSPISRRL
jgi:ABC-type phosphate/phosphonate transport system ATPase subunit